MITAHQVQRATMGIRFPGQRVLLKNLSELQLEKIHEFPESHLDGYQRHRWIQAAQTEQIYRKRKMIVLFSTLKGSLGKELKSFFQEELDEYMQRKIHQKVRQKKFYKSL
jgi:hypothetical protein